MTVGEIDTDCLPSRTMAEGPCTVTRSARRYRPEQWIEMRGRARAIFPNSGYVEEWGVG